MAGTVAFGVDIARSGEDRCVVAIRQGRECLPLVTWQNPDLMESVTTITHLAKKYKPEAMLVDVNGMGAGVFDRLRQLGYSVVPFLAQEGTDETDSSGELMFVNRRSHAWWMLRERLSPHTGHNLVLPNDEELMLDLAAPKYRSMDGSGRIKVELKDDVKKRLRRSPDKGDAVVMAFYEGSSSTYEEGFRSYSPAALREEERRREAEGRAEIAEEALILQSLFDKAVPRSGRLPWDL
jgi:hypothetical protein